MTTLVDAVVRGAQQGEEARTAAAPPHSSSSFLSRPRALYTFVFAWIAVTGGRFLAPFLEHECALSSTTIGVLMALQRLVEIPAASLCGRWADQLEQPQYYPGKGRALLLGAGVLSGTVLFGLHCMSRFFPTNAFWASTAWFLLLRVLSSVSVSLVFPVMDGMCLQYLERTGRPKEEFGKERLYGAISWAVVNLGMAPILDGSAGFRVAYPLSAVSAFAVLFTLVFYSRGSSSLNLPLPQSPPQHQAQSKHQHPIIIKRKTSDLPVVSTGGGDDDGTFSDIEISQDDKDPHPASDAPVSTNDLLRRLLFGSDRGFYFGCAFLFAFTVLAAGQVIVDALVFLYFEKLGSSYALMGWTVVLTVLFEIPIFHIGNQLLERFGSTKLLQAAMGCYVFRVVGYSLLPQGHALYTLFLEPMHGITYACSVTASVDFVADVMPVGYEASGQGIVNAVRGIGSIVGLLLGGWAEDELGPRKMYRSAAVVVLTGSLVLGWASLGRTTTGMTHLHQLVPGEEEDIELTITEEEESSSSDSSLRPEGS